MKKTIIIAVTILLSLGYGQGMNRDHEKMKASSIEKTSVKTEAYFTCPMESHKHIKSDEPGRCSDCYMKLVPTIKLETQVVDVACGECQFGMTGKSCDLAVRFNGKSYFVDGSDIDDHGDAHDVDGLCNTIRTATVTGRVIKDRFKAESIQLISEGDNSETKQN